MIESKDKKTKNPHEKHRQRMRERYMRVGLDGFADHEVIEVLLGYALPRKDTNRIAHNVLEEFGSLHKVLQAKPDEIMERCKLTERTSMLLSLGAPLAKRYDAGRWGQRVAFKTTKKLGAYINSLFTGETRECFYVIGLGNNMTVEWVELSSKGTIDGADIYIREVVRGYFLRDISYIILAHNHPSGSAVVSESDIAATQNVLKTMNNMGIPLLDHIVVCGRKNISMAKKNLISGLTTIEVALELLEAKSEAEKKAIKAGARQKLLLRRRRNV